MAVKTTDEFVIPISVRDEVTDKLKKIEIAVKQVMSSLGKSDSGSGLAQTANNLNNVSKASKSAESSISIYGMTLGKVSAAVFTANAYLDFFNRTLRTFGVIVGGAVAPAVELENGLAKIATVLPEGSNNLNQFSTDIINFQRQFGSDQQSLIAGYYDLLQSGAVEAADATQVMATAQKMAVAGFSTTDKMMQGLVSVMANYNKTAADTVRVADLMSIANKNGRVTIEGLAENIGVVAGLASNMNISLEETLSAMSTISMSTSNASEAMTSFRSIITGLSTQTGEFKDVMERLGYSSIQAMIAQKGFIGTIQALVEEGGMSAEKLSDIFGRVEAKLGIVALTADKTSQVYKKNMDEMAAASNNVGNVIGKQFDIAMNTVGKKSEVLMGNFKTLMASAGLGMVDSIKGALDGLTTVVQGAQKAIDDLGYAYDAFGKKTTELSTLTVILAQSLTALGLATLLVNINSVIGGLTKLAQLIAGIGIIAAAKFALIVGAITAVEMAIETLYKNWDHVAESMHVNLLQIKSDWAAIKTVSREAMEPMIDYLNKVGLISDEWANDFRVNTNKAADAQKILNKELEDSRARVKELGDEFKKPAILEAIMGQSKGAYKLKQDLISFQGDYRAQIKATEEQAKKTTTQIKKLFLDTTLSFNELSKFTLFDDTDLGRYQKALGEVRTAYGLMTDEIAESNKLLNKEPGRKDELTRRVKEASMKYREALFNLEQMFQKDVKESAEKLLDIDVTIGMRTDPYRQQLAKLSKDVDDFNSKSYAMAKTLPVLDRAIAIKKAEFELAKTLYERSQKGQAGLRREGGRVVKPEPEAKIDFLNMQMAYELSVKNKNNVSEQLKLRKEHLLILEQELNRLQEIAKWEANNKDIEAKGGKAIFSTEDYVAMEKTLDKPLNNFTTSLGQVMRDYFAFDKFRDISNYMSDMIYKGFYLGIEDFTDEMSDFWGKAPKMGDVPGMMSNTALSEGMSAMSGAMSGFMGAVSTASQIATAITGAANMVANLPQQFADMFKAITDMPQTFIKGLNSILTEVPRMFAELIPGLLDAFIAIVDFLPKLVDGIFEGLMKLFDSDVFYKVGMAILKYILLGIPKMGLMLLKVVVGVVKLVMKIIKELPRYIKEFIDGFIDGIKEFINEIANTLGFKDIFKIKAKIDDKSLGDISEAIKRGSQQMFSVTDAEGEKKSTGIMVKIMAAIEAADKSLRGLLKGMWAIWKWVRDNILMPLWNVTVDAWRWIWNKIFYPFLSGLKKAWLWIWNKIVSPMLSELKKDFKKMLDNFKKVWLKIWEPLNNKIIKPLQKLFGKLFNGLMTFIGKIMSGVMKIFGLTRPLMNGFSKLIGSIPNIISKIFSGIKSIFNKIPSYLKAGLSKVGKYLTAGLEKVADFFVKLVANLNPFELINQVFKLLSSAGSFLSSAGSKMISGLVNGLSRVWDAFINLGSKIITGIKDGLSSVFSFFYDLGKKIISGIKSAISNIWDKFKELGKKIVDGLKDFLSDAWDKFKELGKKVIDGIKDFLSDAWDKFKELGSKVIDGITSGLSSLWQGFTNLGTKIWEGLETGLGKLATLLSPLTDTFGKIGSFVSDAFESLDLTKLGNTIGDGIKSIIDPLLSAFKSIGNLFVDMLNGLKIPKAGWSISAGSIGSWSGTLWNEIDLIPGEIARFATGGMAMGTDIVPAMLTPGEFIVNKNATSKNIDLLRSINAGREPISSGSSPTFNITINAKTNLDADSIKREIMPTIEKELKRKSLDGSFVIAANGIRK